MDNLRAAQGVIGLRHTVGPERLEAACALTPFEHPADEDFHELIAERYERAATILTSNLDLSEWGSAFPDRLLGAATLDRRRHAAHTVVLDGDSYRTLKPIAKAQKSTLEKAPKTA